MWKYLGRGAYGSRSSPPCHLHTLRRDVEVPWGERVTCVCWPLRPGELQVAYSTSPGWLPDIGAGPPVPPPSYLSTLWYGGGPHPWNRPVLLPDLLIADLLPNPSLPRRPNGWFPPGCIWLGLVAIELVGTRVCRSGPKAATMSRTDSIPNQFELHAFGGGLPVGRRAWGRGWEPQAA